GVGEEGTEEAGERLRRIGRADDEAVARGIGAAEAGAAATGGRVEHDLRPQFGRRRAADADAVLGRAQELFGGRVGRRRRARRQTAARGRSEVGDDSLTCSLTNTLAHRDVVVEVVAELDDAEDQQSQHWEYEGELNKGRAGFICLVPTHHAPASSPLRLWPDHRRTGITALVWPRRLGQARHVAGGPRMSRSN